MYTKPTPFSGRTPGGVSSYAAMSLRNGGTTNEGNYSPSAVSRVDRVDNWSKRRGSGDSPYHYANVSSSSPSPSSYSRNSPSRSELGFGSRENSCSKSPAERYSSGNKELPSASWQTRNNDDASSNGMYNGANLSLNNVNTKIKLKCKWFLPEHRRGDSTDKTSENIAPYSSTAFRTSNNNDFTCHTSLSTNTRPSFSSSTRCPWWKQTTVPNTNGKQQSSVSSHMNQYEGRLRYLGNDNGTDSKPFLRTYSKSCIDLNNGPQSSRSSSRLFGRSSSASSTNFGNSSALYSKHSTGLSSRSHHQLYSSPNAAHGSTNRRSSDYRNGPFYGGRQSSHESADASSSFPSGFHALSSMRIASNKSICLDTFYEMKYKYLTPSVRPDTSLNSNSCNVADQMPGTTNNRNVPSHDYQNTNAFHRHMSTCFMSELTRLQKVSGIIRASTKSQYASLINDIVDEHG